MRKIQIPVVQTIAVKEEFIKLDSLLKLAGAVSTGGEAKELIQNGQVLVDGIPITARGRKIKDGMTVRVRNKILRVKAAREI
jgi:ribosome-associated protein